MGNFLCKIVLLKPGKYILLITSSSRFEATRINATTYQHIRNHALDLCSCRPLIKKGLQDQVQRHHGSCPRLRLGLVGVQQGLWGGRCVRGCMCLKPDVVTAFMTAILFSSLAMVRLRVTARRV